MATAELAVAVPVIMLVLALGLSAVTAAMDQVRCVDAARATARALARGDDQGAALTVGRRLAPPAASFAVDGSDDTVQVSVRSRPPPALRWMGDRAVPRGIAVAAREDVAPPQGVPGAQGGARGE